VRERTDETAVRLRTADVENVRRLLREVLALQGAGADVLNLLLDLVVFGDADAA
jgi:hypothetical protein